MRIGILGGTFDPPHLGHLMIAEEVRVALDLAEVWFIPTNEPPHKDKAASNTLQRLEMLHLAIESNTYFKINRIEIERSGVSYTIDTVNILREMHPENDYYFIIGADMVEFLPKWYKIDELLQKVKFVGVERPNYVFQTDYPVIQVPIEARDISSSMVRKLVSEGEPFSAFLPEAVASYIKEHGLYGYKPNETRS